MRKKSNHFTLIELMAAVMLLATVGILFVRNAQNSMKQLSAARDHALKAALINEAVTKGFLAVNEGESDEVSVGNKVGESDGSDKKDDGSAGGGEDDGALAQDGEFEDYSPIYTWRLQRSQVTLDETTAAQLILIDIYQVDQKVVSVGRLY